MRHRGLFVLTVLTVLTALSVESALSVLRQTQHPPAQEGTCASYGITFDDASIETLHTAPDTVLAAPERFWETDPAYRIGSRYRSGGALSGLAKWTRKLRKISDLSPGMRTRTTS